MKTAEVPAEEVSETAGTAPESLGVGLIEVGITGTMLRVRFKSYLSFLARLACGV